MGGVNRKRGERVQKEADWKIGPDMRIGRCSLKIWPIWTESERQGDMEIGQEVRETGGHGNRRTERQEDRETGEHGDRRTER